MLLGKACSPRGFHHVVEEPGLSCWAAVAIECPLHNTRQQSLKGVYKVA